ncbi:MAG: tRNA (N(6)-L-threonylcarbamoyladenosine(37)-C(2))-methylthiotransferase MtaB [Eubacteriales bacterium]|jgi:threonylcarbamoyladenosine tRNA methylthiotransferase MtaB|nr:tRNA (N(6)-L-threonylcarbamoyladenosine(37)-C(2))-methylthiotransferase MtaB [Eubacteriales bacterium]
MKKVASHALGCKVNQYESEAIAELFAQKGYEIVDIDEWADIYIINTCTVTNFGDKKSRQLIRKVKRQNPEAVVAAIGCYAQTAPDEIKNIEGVNLIIGTKGRKDIVDLVESYVPEMGVVSTVGQIAKEREFEHLTISKLADRTRAYLKIQDGCSQFCSYCIIPYARGPIRSRDPEDIMDEVKVLAENGFKEIILTGIHVASYGKDLKGVTLLDVIKRVQEQEGIERIRFSSVEPNIVTEEFASELSKLDKVCDHFHLSLQSGCDRTLKRMNRKYDAAGYERAVEILRKYFPNVAITTDIIAGFPDETDEDFEKSLEFAKKIGFAKIHAFPYSPKRGTPAAVMPNQILNAVKNERTSRLIEASDRMADEFIKSFEGRVMPVLYEREIEHNIYEGYTTNYIRVLSESSENIKNKILDTEIVSSEDEKAIGRIL